ncbi:MAG TPA: nucleoside 2-deoxyribosyltransferase [Bellilinea sp.]|nr:nucleoside 2-deoxyribosyltransferase [Bellilinea sp.]
MKIYFSCSITGGRRDQAVYQLIVDHLIAQGHEVLTASLASANIMDLEVIISPHEVFERDVRWVEECDLLVAEVSTPSHGVGYEIMLALSLRKPVICLYRYGVIVSKMLLGNSMPGFRIAAYAGDDDVIPKFDTLMKGGRNNASTSN